MRKENFQRQTEESMASAVEKSSKVDEWTDCQTTVAIVRGTWPGENVSAR